MENLSKNATKSKYFVRIFFSAAQNRNNLWITTGACHDLNIRCI
ncbi:hypothetical protein RHECNPAF_430058 [Rhizobium etli CNPAF512]|nr:hypothetical protein RHECNPAF_430058 [Rhizobium etli CNPAF512]